MNDSNKQFIAVVVFILFLIVAISGLAISSSKDDKIKTDNSVTSNTSNNVDIIDSEITIPEVEDSKPVKVITSNNIVSNTSKSNTSVVTSNSTVSNNTKNSNKIPVSYFITELDKNKIYVGGVANISVTIKPDNATDKSVKYDSTDSSIARVTQTGTIIGISPGTCYIDITVSGGGTSRVAITVVSKSSSNSNKSNNNSSTSNKSSNVIDTIVSNVNSNSTIISNRNSNTTSNSTSNKVSNTTSNSNKVSNSNSNTTSNKVSNSNSNSNTIVNVTGISLSKSSVTLTKGSKTTLSATVSPSNATNKNITWSSSNTGVATVSNGTVTAVNAGKATITASSSNGKTATCTVIIDGWTNDKKNYYKNGSKVTNSYVDYIYLDSNGNAMSKIGPFSITMYGARAWVVDWSANQTSPINMRASATSSSSLVTTVPIGGKMTIIGEESNGYVKVKYNSYTGYVWTAYIMINLPDVIPGIKYDITNGYSSIFKSSDVSIPNITGKNLYGYSKQYNSKTGQTTYYAPILYPVAKKIQTAYNAASKDGYSFIIYDTYRPTDIAAKVSTNLASLVSTNATVRNGVNYDKQGNWWGTSWFIANNGKTNHARGIAVDLALSDSKGNELSAQTKMHALDTRALRKYNNTNANILSKYMVTYGKLGTLDSEWWHFEDTTYKNYGFCSFKIS